MHEYCGTVVEVIVMMRKTIVALVFLETICKRIGMIWTKATQSLTCIHIGKSHPILMALRPITRAAMNWII